MFCKNCGKEIDDKAAVCIHCGVPTSNSQPQQVFVTTPRSNGFAIAGFIISFFGAFLGLILSIVGLQKSKLPEYNGNGRGLSIAGIIISCISLAYWIIIIAVCSAAGCAALNDPNLANAALLPLV